MTTAPYVYRIERVHRIVDGDTYDLTVDVGFHLYATVRVRLHGWDTPEMSKGSAHERAEAARARSVASMWFNTSLLSGPAATWWVRTEKDPDAFGRWLGDVWVEQGGRVQSLGRILEQNELATPWPTRWRDVHDHG